jgi:hypothetical protein
MLQGVSASIDEGTISPRLLLIGKRLNIKDALNDAAQLTNINTSYWQGRSRTPEVRRAEPQYQLRDRLRKSLVEFSHRATNTWMTEFSEDFFFFTAETFNGLEYPEFVAGRVGWDSWLVQWALDNNVKVIDTTKLLHVSHLTADDGNLAGWNTARPDKMWNYCALDSWCKEGTTAWREFCKSCFRCKLGGTSQGSHRLARGSTRGSLAVARVDDRDPEVAAAEELENVVVISNLLRAHNLPASKASSFWTAVKEPTPMCKSTGKCCSMTGNWAVQHELRAGYEIRGVWPSKGMYPPPLEATGAENAADGEIKGSNEMDVDGVVVKEESVGGGVGVGVNTPVPPVPPDLRWCKPWENLAWSVPPSPSPLSPDICLASIDPPLPLP